MIDKKNSFTNYIVTITIDQLITISIDLDYLCERIS